MSAYAKSTIGKSKLKNLTELDDILHVINAQRKRKAKFTELRERIINGYESPSPPLPLAKLPRRDPNWREKLINQWVSSVPPVPPIFIETPLQTPTSPISKFQRFNNFLRNLFKYESKSS